MEDTRFIFLILFLQTNKINSLLKMSSLIPKQYSNLNKKELIELCKTHQIKGYSNKKRDELIDMIQSNLNPVSQIYNQYNVGDNLDLLKTLKDESIDMIYTDPPYDTGRNFGDFNDKFVDFKAFIRPRIEECHRVLKKNGSIIIHVEPRISHHIRYICDDVFGENNFQNEIVWHSGGNAKNKYQLARNHDTIIVYGKSSKTKFFPQYKPYDDKYKKGLKMCPHHKKLYSTSAAHNSQPDVNPRPNLRYEWKGNTRQWYFSIDKMKELDKDNRLEYNDKNIPRIKRFVDEMDGIPIRDTWDDISNTQGNEKLSYATQKPIKLLERILDLYTEEGDICLDPFAGSGSLGRACIKNKRQYLLFDVNPNGKNVFEKSIS